MRSEHKELPAIADPSRRKCARQESRASRWTRGNAQSSRLRSNANDEAYVLPRVARVAEPRCRGMQGPTLFFSSRSVQLRLR
eukprot:12878014-Alexandrium_andersonii.AAC.1